MLSQLDHIIQISSRFNVSTIGWILIVSYRIPMIIQIYLQLPVKSGPLLQNIENINHLKRYI